MPSVEKRKRNKGKDRTRFELLTTYLLVLLLRRFAGGGYKGVRIDCVSVYIALRDTCVAGVTMTKGQAKYTCIYGSKITYTSYYIHIIQIDHHGSFMRHPSLVPSHPPYSFTSPLFRPPPYGRLLLDLDPPFPIPFHPSTNPLTIAHVFNNRINKR
jgi:hypothetical protein